MSLRMTLNYSFSSAFSPALLVLSVCAASLKHEIDSEFYAPDMVIYSAYYCYLFLILSILTRPSEALCIFLLCF